MTDATQDEKKKKTKTTATAESDMQEGVKFNDDGTISMVIGDEAYRLRTPRFGEFKQFKREMFEAATAVQELANEAHIDMAQLALRQMTGISPEVEKIVDASTESTMTLLRHIVAVLSDKTLPEDEDTWPMWLITSDTLTANMIDHWRTVPLGRG